jgi:hypothetical protein
MKWGLLISSRAECLGQCRQLRALRVAVPAPHPWRARSEGLGGVARRALFALRSRGRQKTDIGDPRGGSEAKKGPGPDFFLSAWFFFADFFVKPFRQDAPCPSLRNTRKRDKTKKVEEKLTSIFCRFFGFWEKFSTWNFCKKYLCGVFELPSPRSAQKRTKNENPRNQKVGWWVGGGSGI